jgi:hypothetical protein
MITIQEFVNRYKLAVKCVSTFENPHMRDDNWSRSARHWNCKLYSTRSADSPTMTVFFSQSSAHTKPTISDLISTLAMDASGLRAALGFEDWANEYGYDTDSRDAYETYRTVKRQTDKFADFLYEIDPDAIDLLLSGEVEY